MLPFDRHTRLLLDSVKEKPKASVSIVPKDDKGQPLSASQIHAAQSLCLDSVSSVQEWASMGPDAFSDDDGDDSPADVLMELLIGTAADGSEEIDEDTADVIEASMNSAWDYLASKGASEADLDTLFNSDDTTEQNAAAVRVLELVREGMPEGDDAMAEEAEDFSMGPSAVQGVFDSAVYRKVWAIRGGKKKRIGKRIAGRVILSAGRKMAVRKATLRSKSSAAKFKRARSNRLRKSYNL